MTHHILDTDCIVDLLAGISTSVDFVRQLVLDGATPCTCAVVLGEVYSGLRPHKREQAVELLGAMLFLETSAEMAERAGDWRYAFARRGVTLAMTDCLIAATAEGHEAGVVTGNLKDFPMAQLRIVPLPRPLR